MRGHCGDTEKLKEEQAECKNPKKNGHVFVNMVYTIAVVNIFAKINNFSQRQTILLKY